jgi:DNA-binding MarR family transcriptional regulator
MSSENDNGRFAYDGLERIIHERARLSILTSLASHPKGLPFNDLKSLCSLTDGNLSRHMSALAEAGLVEIEKSEMNNRSLTRCRLTDVGRSRFLNYLSVLESLLSDAQKVSTAVPSTEGLAPA